MENLFLFIPSIVHQDWTNFYLRCGIVALLWFGVTIACIIDLRSSIKKNRAIFGTKVRSSGLRKTWKKMTEYFAFLGFGFIMDFGLSSFMLIDDIFPILRVLIVPWASVAMFIAIMWTEVKSYFENVNATKSGVVIDQGIFDILNVAIKTLGPEKLRDFADQLTETFKKTNTKQNNDGPVQK